MSNFNLVIFILFDIRGLFSFIHPQKTFSATFLMYFTLNRSTNFQLLHKLNMEDVYSHSDQTVNKINFSVHI